MWTAHEAVSISKQLRMSTSDEQRQQCLKSKCNCKEVFAMYFKSYVLTVIS